MPINWSSKEQANELCPTLARYLTKGYGTTQHPEILLLINSAATMDFDFPISLGLEKRKESK